MGPHVPDTRLDLGPFGRRCRPSLALVMFFGVPISAIKAQA
jgi:hypothetical protein